MTKENTMVESKIVAALIRGHETPEEAAEVIEAFFADRGRLAVVAAVEALLEKRRAANREYQRRAQVKRRSAENQLTSSEGGISVSLLSLSEKENTQTQSPAQLNSAETPKKPLPPDFVRFWQVYPRKAKKAAALKAWRKIKPPIAECLKTLEWQVKSADWKKDKGEYIPHPASWLNDERWQDEPTEGSIPFVPLHFREPILPPPPRTTVKNGHGF